MSDKERAIEIAKKFIGLEEHIKALNSVLSQHMNQEKMEKFGRAVFQAESQARLDEPSPTRFDQCERAIDAAKDDALLIPILYQNLGILGNLTV